MANALELRVKRPQRSIPESEWGWASEASALSSMIATSGLQEKTVAIEAEIDACEQWHEENGSLYKSA